MRRLAPLGIAALLALTLLPGIASVPALDTREARDAVVALEMQQSSEWITPLYGREALFEKPALGYSLEWVARRVLNGGTTVSRVVRTFVAALLVAIVVTIGSASFGARAGWLAGAALATSLGLPLAARADGGQLLATLCAWLAIGAFLPAVLAARTGGALAERDRPRVAGWLAIALALVIGGPLPALWPLAGFALHAALARRGADIRALWLGPGLLLVAGFALPWYGAMAALHGGAFLARVAWFPYGAETRGAWWLGPFLAPTFLVVTAFPWSPVVAASVRDAARRLRERTAGTRAPAPERDAPATGHAAHVVLALQFAALAPIALYPGPPLSAALPALPATALLAGRFLDRVLAGDAATASLLPGATLMSALLGTAGAILLSFVSTVVHDATTPLRHVAAVVLVTSWAPMLATMLGRRRLATALFVLPVALGAPLLERGVLPAMERWLNARATARLMIAASPPDAPLVLLEPPPPSLRLALPRNFVVAPRPAAALLANASSDGRAYVAFRPAFELDVVRAAPGPLDVLSRTPTLVLARVLARPPAP